MTRRPPKAEPARCECEPGGDAAREHGRPGAKAAKHLASCAHSELRHTTKPQKKGRTVPRIVPDRPLLPRGRPDVTGIWTSYPDED
jgi:hypothetical protein